MSKAAATLQIQAPALVPASSLVQRKCACGGNASALQGECESCRQKKLGLQTKLALGTPGDAYEQEADRVADEVMRMGEPSVQRRMGGPSIQRQSPTDEKKETPPPKPTEDAAAAPVAVAAAQPSCSATGMTRANFLKEPGTSAKDFGLTALDLSAVTYPELVTEKTKGGVRVKPTSAALPTIPSVYTGSDTFTEGEAHFLGQNNGDCASKKYPIRWTITPPGATKIGEGEQEHCADFNQAFDISLKRYAAAVNGLAGKTFGNDKKAEQAVVKTTGAAPADWYSIFSCLARKTLARDTTSHTPKPTTREPRLATNCAFVSAYITGTSLPQVGQTASADLIKDCGETGAASKAKTKSARQTSGEVGMPDLSSETWEAWAADADSEEAALLQRKSAPGAERASAPPASVHHALAASGQPLDATTKSFMESRFGHDFGQVRLHTDSTADQSAREVDALAYTVGAHVVFRAGSFAPHTGEGRKLLAHELTHVVQQSGAQSMEGEQASDQSSTSPASVLRRQPSSTEDWQYEAERMSTEELEREVEQMQTALLALDETTEESEQLQEKFAVFESALVARLGARSRFQAGVAEARQAQRDITEVTRGTALEGAGVMLAQQSSQALFVMGFATGYASEVPPGELEDFQREMREEWLAFNLGYMQGLPIGLWHGLSGLVQGVGMLLKIGVAMSPSNIAATVSEEAARLVIDPAHRAQRRREYAQMRAFAAALEAFGEEFRADPSIVMQWSSDLGLALGQELGTWVTTDFLRKSASDKGYIVGDIAGQVLFEVLTEILLAVATEGVGNVLRGAAAVGQGARAGGRVASIIRRMLETSPALRSLLIAAGGSEDAADMLRLGERGADELLEAGARVADESPSAPGGVSAAPSEALPAPRPASTPAAPHRPTPEVEAPPAARALPDWQEDYIQDFLDEVEDRGLMLAERDIAESELRRQLVGVSDDEATAIFNQWERGLETDDIRQIMQGTSEGSAFGLSPSDPDVLDLPNPRQIDEIASEPAAGRLSTRSVWEPPPGATPAPDLEAPQEQRVQWLRERLRIHVEQAMDRLDVEGLTPAQAADVRRYATHRGSRIDQFAKESVMQDPELAQLITAPDFISEPDILDSIVPDWFDVTTRRSWEDHLLRYQRRYGDAAHLLETRRGAP